MAKMAATRKARGQSDREKAKVVVEKIEDAVEIVKLPPVYSPDSKFLCLVSGRLVRVYSVGNGEKIYSLNLHNSDIIGMSMKNDVTLVTCDESGKIIEWNIITGKKLQNKSIKVGNGKNKFLSFLSPLPDVYLVTSTLQFGKGVSSNNNISHADLWLIDSHMKERKIFGMIRNNPTAVTYGCQGSGSVVVAAIKDDCVVVKDLKSGTSKLHMTDDRTFTCVALHPTEMIMATGDISGRILIWHDFIQLTKPPKTVCHWHTLPVNSICFSHDGNYFLSGGWEKTLVKWRLGSTHKQFLPRMGAVIKYVTCAPDNMCITTSHTDNALRFINGVNKISHAILGLIKHDPICGIEGRESLMPVGLVWDPRSRGLFFNGQAGHLQLFDLEHGSIIFNLDIANRNILTDERNQVIGNTEVLRATLTSDGMWLATYEAWSDTTIGCQDMQLKLWQFNASLTNYELNTNVSTPHSDGVLDLTFQPGLLGQQSPCLVSIGLDAKFKIWRLVDDSDIYKKKEAWTCDVAGDFRHMQPTAVSFSEDGSLLAISFGDTVTLWDPFTSLLKTTLTHSLVNEPIRFMEFGRDQCFRYLVCATERSIFTWDVITHGIIWKVAHLSARVIDLAADPKSMYMVAVLQNSDVFVFAPSSSKPVYQHQKALNSMPIAAVFVPRPNPLANGSEWLTSSRIVIADDSQELYYLDDQCGNDINKKVTAGVSYMDSLPWTPFAAMKAQHKIDAAKKLTPVVHETKGILGYESVQTLMETPSSTLPPMSRICSSFLCSLMKPHDLTKSSTSHPPASDVSDLALVGVNGNSKSVEDKLVTPKGSAVSQDELLINIFVSDFDWLYKTLEQ